MRSLGGILEQSTVSVQVEQFVRHAWSLGRVSFLSVLRAMDGHTMAGKLNNLGRASVLFEEKFFCSRQFPKFSLHFRFRHKTFKSISGFTPARKPGCSCCASSRFRLLSGTLARFSLAGNRCFACASRSPGRGPRVLTRSWKSLAPARRPRFSAGPQWLFPSAQLSQSPRSRRGLAFAARRARRGRSCPGAGCPGSPARS
mmetsp:Transcript_4898/g.12178  ORF Transcript_4898/g.12178 Transcript_4898/m.12178 type:complete len:200 (+) Transcript_4898:144-743(+)